ncbi:MAG: hypothetical protein KIT33_15310 [Candidatus Kapabacteria bacterium]|nr:hypothetical protein [Ignavibacteriota bacterium]MCW5886337.1 hypothetical protein [Candidatus Kapabacteria bacterium]
MEKTAKDLADLIEQNSNCIIIIDNDSWDVFADEAMYKKAEPLAESDDYIFDTKWYGDANEYGFGIADALVLLLNRKGFNIKASAC